MNSPRKSSTLIRRLWTGSIRGRLILAISALLALVMSAFVADMTRRQVDYLHQESRSEVLALARMLAANSVSWVLASDLAGLQEVVQVLKGYPDMRYAMILTPEGKVLAHTDPQLPGRYARDAISESLLRAPLTPQLLVDTEVLVDLAAPIEANGALIGWARVSLGQDRVNANYREIARNGIIYAAFAIALGILLAVILTRGLTRDLARLVKAARRIGAGERGVQSGLAREDELGALSSTFDRMTLDLDRANQELRKSEKDLKEAQRLAQIGSWDWDIATDTISWSEEYYRIYGFDPMQRPPGYQEHLKAYTPESAARLDAAVKANTQTGEPYELELELARTEGPRRWITARSETKRDAQGQITGLRGTAQDISARKHAEDALREREEYIGKLVDKSPLAMVVSAGTEQRVEYLNQKFTALFGYTIADMPDVAHWWMLAYPEEKYREQIKAKWSERVTRSIESKEEIEPIEATVRCKDGSFRYIEFRLASIGARNLVTFVDLTERRRAEQAALDQFKLAETFFSNSVSGLVILDRNFNFVRVNEAYARACRREIGEFAGRNHFDMYPSDMQAIFEDVVRSKRPFTTFTRAFEFPDQPERGTTYWDWTLAPILDQQREVEYLVFSLQEVTERKRAEEVQRTAALYARSLIEASLDPLVTISPAGKITDVNKTTEDVTGIARDRLVGTDFADYFTEPDKARAGYQEVLARGYVRDYPLTIRHGSGRATDVLYNATVYRNEAGELQGVFAAARDVTERKQADAVRAQLAAIVQSSHDAIIGKDLDGVITSWNPGAEKVYGYRAEEIIGKSVSMLAPEGRKHEITDLIENVRRAEAVINFDTERLRKDGKLIDISLDLSPIRDAAGRIVGASTIARDITEKKQAERALRKVNRALKALSSCNEVLIHATDETRLLNEICRVIVDIEGYLLTWVGYVEHDSGKTVRPMAQSGYKPGYMEHADISWADNERGRGPLGIAIRTGQIQVVQDVATDTRFEPWRANAARLGYGSVLVAPLLSDSKVIGALSIYAEGADAFDAGEIALLSELAADMSFGIVTLRTRGAHERSAAQLQRSMEATIQVIANTVEMRDPYTSGHQRRVADLATAIARDMGLTEEQVHGIHLASVVHDLGKVHIPAEILSKPGKLSAIEFELIKAHSEAGYDILKGVDFPWPIAQIVFQHHERLDGSGYPRRLKANEILLEAKILMVADVVEAMASHRPYRPALGIELALQEISANAGKCYDADVVRVCLALFREKAFTFKI